MARVHVVIPDDVLRDIDELAGRRRRSDYIASAVREQARVDKLRRAIHEGAGVVDVKKHPEWETTEKVVQWIKELRDTPSIRKDPLDEVLARLKRGNRVAKGARGRGRAP